MIYLDTHVVVWLFSGRLEKFSEETKALITAQSIFISPCVRLELQYLHEIERINVEANEIVTDLSERIGLGVCDKDFNSVVSKAMTMDWTRDPFDRMISAHAGINNNILVTKDQSILDNYSNASW